MGTNRLESTLMGPKANNGFKTVFGSMPSVTGAWEKNVKNPISFSFFKVIFFPST